jgi:hypothetical protein
MDFKVSSSLDNEEDYIFSAEELAEIDEMLALEEDEDDYELTPEELSEADTLFASECDDGSEFTEEELALLKLI